MDLNPFNDEKDARISVEGYNLEENLHDDYMINYLGFVNSNDFDFDASKSVEVIYGQDLQNMQPMINGLMPGVDGSFDPGNGDELKKRMCHICKYACDNRYYLRVHLINEHGFPISEEAFFQMLNFTSGMNFLDHPLRQCDMIGNGSSEIYNKEIDTNQTIAATIKAAIPAGLFPNFDSINLNLQKNLCFLLNKELCDKYFMKTHIRKMHNINIDPNSTEFEQSSIIGGVECDICHKELCNKYFLKTHKRNTHSIDEDASPPLLGINDRSFPSNDVRMSHPGPSTLSSVKLKLKLDDTNSERVLLNCNQNSSSLPVPVSHSNVQSNQNIIEVNEDNETNKKIITIRLQCFDQNCQKMFDNKTKLDRHMRLEHNILWNRCFVKNCNLSFVNKYQIQVHSQQHHSNEKIFFCGKCSKGYLEYALLFQHDYQKHQLGQYKCKFPNCEFVGQYRQKVVTHYSTHNRIVDEIICPYPNCGHRVHRKNFQIHFKSHEGIKSFFCKWSGCERAFTRAEGAISHINTIHLKQGSKETTPINPRDFLLKKPIHFTVRRIQ